MTAESVTDALAALTPATANRLLTIIRAALRLAAARGWILSAPKLAPRKTPKRAFRWLTRQEWESLYVELAPHLQAMALFAVSTGLRWSNVAHLRWQNVDLEGKRAWIDADAAKGGKAIAVPLSREALRALRMARKAQELDVKQVERVRRRVSRPEARAAAPGEGFVFTYAGRPILSPKTGWREAIARAGIRSVRWHDLRHTWASWHVMNGTPLKALQELGGWASLDQVMIYAHLAPSHVASYADNARAPLLRRRKAA